MAEPSAACKDARMPKQEEEYAAARRASESLEVCAHWRRCCVGWMAQKRPSGEAAAALQGWEPAHLKMTMEPQQQWVRRGAWSGWAWLALGPQQSRL